MGQALKDTSIDNFKVPEGITLMKVNIETGLPSNESSPETILEAFVDGSIPVEKEGHEKEESSSAAPVKGRSPMEPQSQSDF
jgi:membrane carboxypeptidase/penicillin-binding protein